MNESELLLLKKQLRLCLGLWVLLKNKCSPLRCLRLDVKVFFQVFLTSITGSLKYRSNALTTMLGRHTMKKHAFHIKVPSSGYTSIPYIFSDIKFDK